MEPSDFINLMLTNPDKLNRELNKLNEADRSKLLREMDVIINNNVIRAEAASNKMNPLAARHLPLGGSKRKTRRSHSKKRRTMKKRMH
jgi:hypothetical protein